MIMKSGTGSTRRKVSPPVTPELKLMRGGKVSVELMKANYEAMDWPTVAETIRHLQAQKFEHEEAVKGLNESLKLMCVDVIPDKMAEQGLRGVPLADGGRIELRQKAFCSVRGGCKPQLEAWLNEVDAADIIQPTVNASTLKAFCKERIDQGLGIPEDIINYQPFLEATLIKGR